MVRVCVSLQSSNISHRLLHPGVYVMNLVHICILKDEALVFGLERVRQIASILVIYALMLRIENFQDARDGALI